MHKERVTCAWRALEIKYQTVERAWTWSDVIRKCLTVIYMHTPDNPPMDICATKVIFLSLVVAILMHACKANHKYEKPNLSYYSA